MPWSESGGPPRTLEDAHFVLEKEDSSAEAVAAARRLLALAGFNENDQFMVATAVSELATNIIRYAVKGELTLRLVEQEGREGIEVVAQDEGPGISDLDKALTDHFSSGGSLGLGLPSVKRIMDDFHIESREGAGVMVIARKWKRP